MQRRARAGLRPGSYLLLIVAAALLFSALAIPTHSALKRSEREVHDLQLERMRIRDTIEELEAELAYRSTDAYVERVARDELGYIRPGEIRYLSADA